MGKKGKKGGGGGGRPQPGEAGTSNQPEQERQQPQQQQQQRQQQPQQQQQQRQQQPQQQQQRQQQPQQQQQWQPQPQQQPQQQQRQQQPQQQQQRQQQPQQQQQQWQPQPQQQQRPQQQPQQQQWQPQPQQQQRSQQPQQHWQPQPQPQQHQRQQQQQQHQRIQDAPQNFPLPGAGDFSSKKNKKRGGRQAQGFPQQESGAGPSAVPPQQAFQHRQPAPPQPLPQEQRIQPPSDSAVGQVRPAPFMGHQGMEQQGRPQQPLGQQQQARFPLQAGHRGQPPQWVQRGPSPQQISRPQSRETTPTQQPPQQQPVSPITDSPPIRQQPVGQPSVRASPSQSQVVPQPKSPPGGSALTEKMKSLSTKSTSIPPKRADRPSEPKKGREITVETNHLNLNIKNKNMVVHHYDVSINPEKPYRNYRQAVEAVRKRCFKNRYPAFDGKKNLYSYPELPFQTAELVETVSIYDSERDQEKEMTVTIKYATEVNISMIWDYLRSGTSTNAPQEAIQALDIVLRHPAANRFVTVGRSFFTPPPGRVVDLGFGLDLWYGFFQSAIIGWKPYLNIDVAHKGFPAPCNCVDALRKFIYKDADVADPRFQMKPYEQESFNSYIRDLKVAYEIPLKSVKRTYKVNTTTLCPRDNRFEIIDKGTNNKSETTVERYFFSQYNVKLRYPHLPCLSVGSREKPLALPMELCTIVPGQVTMKKMNDMQTRTMVKEAAVDTERRKQKIMKSIYQINFNNDPCLREFGLSVDDQFTKVKARIMNAPTVDYREQQVSVRQGTWRSEKFIQGAELVHWRIVNTNPMVRETELRKLAVDLINYGRDCGMTISNNYKIVSKNTPRDLEQYFNQCLKEEVKLAIVILPDRGMTYASIKKSAELQVGILTQCLKSITVQRRLNAATFINILQKINAKLNGVNHHITKSFWPTFFQKPVIVVGADVTHPAPDQVNVPSIAAVAASYDPKAFRYNMIWKLQPPREEVIRDLESIMKEQLLMFYKNTSQKPQAILFYRDGVSEGQFKIILDQELMAIRRACRSLSADYTPPITFVVVQKRHHTRFFPDKKDADGRNMNVPAGTVVDTDITHPTELDFYLVSHASIQGTARPTKYHLLWDDSNLSERCLEEISYYLCHLFTRCTRSVSYPAPTYYAHLAAFRARAYTDAERLQLNQLQEEQNRRTVKDSVCKRNPMFFV